jgi:alcohol dehydrogenase class IV
VRPFELYQPTQVIFERHAERRAGSFAQLFGSRALLVFGSVSARAMGLVNEIHQSLEARGVHVEHLEGVPHNPTTSIVDAGGALVRANQIDVIIAAGGGSVLDVGKAIAVSSQMSRPFRTTLSGIAGEGSRIDAALPMIAIPTLIGSGSETNGTCVIIDDVSGRKLSMHSDLAAPRVALLDPAWTAWAPTELIAAGIADALAHALEAGLSQRSSIASDALAEVAARRLLADGPAAVDGDAGATARCLWASNLAGQALSLAGSIATHPLAHPLSARCNAHHGEAVAALEPLVLVYLAERFGARAQKVGHWFGSKAGTPTSAMKSIVAKLTSWQEELGIHTTAAQLGLASELIDRFVDDVLASGSRGLANTPGPVLSAAEISDIYLAALNSTPDAPPKLGRRGSTAAPKKPAPKKADKPAAKKAGTKKASKVSATTKSPAKKTTGKAASTSGPPKSDAKKTDPSASQPADAKSPASV